MTADGDIPQRRVKLVASTGDITKAPSSASSDEDGHDIHGYFESAQWTADGTTLLTYSSENLISGYIVPQNLLSPHDGPLSLSPQASFRLPEPSNVLCSAPYFSLVEPWTQQLLVSARDHPIQLFYLAPSTQASHPPIASYPFTKARSETFLTASSLLWSSPGSHFVAGSRSLLARFDIQRTGDEPLTRIRTIPSERHIAKGNGIGMRGTVSALGAQPADLGNGASLVAAGTWTRWIGLYDFAQAGECAATWSIASAVKDATATNGSDIGGDGITQTVWSPCGRYLVVAERKSLGALIYDVRVTGKLLGYINGRDALGNQRVALDVYPGTDEQSGFEIWSGTSSGAVRVWEGIGTQEGVYEPSWAWDAHNSTVGSVCLHRSGTVVATCAGSWEFPDEGGSASQNGLGQETHGSDDESQSEATDPDQELHWMSRRNKESSLSIWSTSTLQNNPEKNRGITRMMTERHSRRSIG
ncbi:hypothetical protein F5Y18DRAFT_213819 [Xylariaceae sp. FL1019]|nr:hypothetical protein F5Y18DRAFT_213819 [Xylariaceae sp. FL1019]